jgi:hypothetical protein
VSIRERIDALMRENRRERSTERERELLTLRHQAGVELLADPPPPAPRPEPEFEGLGDGPVPETTPECLTPELLRGAILKGGCVIVRGLFESERALAFADGIERAMKAREERQQLHSAATDGEGSLEAASDYKDLFRADEQGFYGHFEAQAQYDLTSRLWVTALGGIWAADSPRLMFEMLETFDRAGLSDVIHGYLGEPPALSVQKSTLRKAVPSEIGGSVGWHQDGRFLGDVSALNVWVTLTHCGDDAPGLYLVPRRIEEFLETGAGGSIGSVVIPPALVDQARGDTEIVKPIFEPGDAMLFDDLFLHSTAADPAMPNHRYAIESWFFGPSKFPKDYAPLAL